RSPVPCDPVRSSSPRPRHARSFANGSPPSIAVPSSPHSLPVPRPFASSMPVLASVLASGSSPILAASPSHQHFGTHSPSPLKQNGPIFSQLQNDVCGFPEGPGKWPGHLLITLGETCLR